MTTRTADFPTPPTCLLSTCRCPRCRKQRKAETWIAFNGPVPSASGKTERWMVVAKDGGEPLGEVKWFGRWRKYAFFPDSGCLFEQDCLRVIAEFCERQTRALHQQWQQRSGTK